MLVYKYNNEWIEWNKKTLPSGVTPPPNAEDVIPDEDLNSIGLFKLPPKLYGDDNYIFINHRIVDDANEFPVWEYDLQEKPEPEIGEVSLVPNYVTNFQARAILLQANLFAEVNSTILSSNNIMAIQAWEYANEIGRYGALTTAFANTFGWSESFIDDLFIAAASVEA